MKLIHPLHKSQLENQLDALAKGLPILFVLPNGRIYSDFDQPVNRNEINDELLRIEVDSDHPGLNVEWITSKGGPAAMVTFFQDFQDFQILEDTKKRVHILMNTSIIDDPWCYPALKPWLHPDDEVCVLAFSFFDDTKTPHDWDLQYKKPTGCWYKANTDVFGRFGIPEHHVHWLNYFLDDKEQMQKTIARSSVLLLTGGAPDLMMKRIQEKKLGRLLKAYQGTIIGYSAGAMVQLGDYHIAPDQDYPEFSWQRGLGWLNDFDIEVHYHATSHQKRWLEHVQSENPRPVYCIYEEGGLIVHDGKVDCFGQVDYLEGNPEAKKAEKTRKSEKKQKKDKSKKRRK